METLTTSRTPEDNLNWAEFNAAVNRLKLNKATGPDGIPAEVYKFCPAIKADCSSC